MLYHTWLFKNHNVQLVEGLYCFTYTISDIIMKKVEKDSTISYIDSECIMGARDDEYDYLFKGVEWSLRPDPYM